MVRTSGLGEEPRQKLGYTVFILENHVVFQKEVFAHEEITIRIRIHDYDAKRIHAFMTLHNSDGNQCATFEVMYMGIDRESGRPAPFPEKIAESVKNYYDSQNNDVELKELGSRIGIRR